MIFQGETRTSYPNNPTRIAIIYCNNIMNKTYFARVAVRVRIVRLMFYRGGMRYDSYIIHIQVYTTVARRQIKRRFSSTR